jgi:hypothetical protein
VQTLADETAFSKTAKMLDITWVFNLSQPRLRFLGSQGRIRLSFTLAGSRTPKGDDTWEFDPGYEVAIETQLLNVTGTLSDLSKPATAEFVPAAADSQNTTPANSITLMPLDSGAAQAVCLNLADKDISVEIVSTAGQDLPDELILVQTRLKEHIRSAIGLKYYIAGLSNVYSPSASSTLLKPKAFCFTCVAGNTDNKTPGTLCMWISVEGGDNGGARASGQTSVTFHPADNDLHPIPKDCTASIIFSHKTMSNYIVV